MKALFLVVVLGLAVIGYGIDTEAFISQCLEAHNDERTPLGIKPLIWSTDLAASALAWAKTLASTNSLKLSSGRVDTGENLSRISTRNNSLALLLNVWIAEKRNFINKPYPYCSATGSSNDVGHYTQIIWQNTTQVGCGLATGFGRDYLVCHYKSMGNKLNQYVYGKPPAPPVQTAPVQTQTPFVTQILETHNVERTALGIPSLTWSSELATTALAWANVIAANNTLKHSTNRVQVGENIALASTQPNNLGRLLGLWTAEKKYFINGPYPNCSTTGDAADVGHYTQLIWKATTQVGCGLATAHGRDFLVCQYKLYGNIRGYKAY